MCFGFNPSALLGKTTRWECVGDGWLARTNSVAAILDSLRQPDVGTRQSCEKQGPGDAGENWRGGMHAGICVRCGC